MALFVISGVPAAGKTTVARLLAARLDRAVCVPGDAIRAMVVSGRADMAPDGGRAQLRQLLLRYQGALAVAAVYLRAGFDVIVEDVIIGAVLSDFLIMVPVPELHLVFLNPDAPTVAERDANRGKTAYGERWDVADLHETLRLDTERAGLWLDSTGLTPDQTVDRILGDLEASRLLLSRPSVPDGPRARFGPPR
jgi:predicted ATPase